MLDLVRVSLAEAVWRKSGRPGALGLLVVAGGGERGDGASFGLFISLREVVLPESLEGIRGGEESEELRGGRPPGTGGNGWVGGVARGGLRGGEVDDDGVLEEEGSGE